MLLMLQTAVQTPRSILRPAGEAARSISTLSWIVFAVFSVVAVIMWILIAWAAARRRGTLDEHAPVDAGGGQGWIYLGGFAIPTVILAVIFVLGLVTMSGFPLHDGETPNPSIRVIGHQWWWEVQYIAGSPNERVNTANEIHIPVGQVVDVELITMDVIHSFWVPELHGKVDLVPGQSNYVRLHAERAGVYHGQCAELCGAQHANMLLTVVAEPQEQYQSWLDHQRENALPPSDPDAVKGEQVFLEKPCALCHSVRGTLARGGVAPDLTHVGSRGRIASNMLVNDDANMAAWLTHAQSLKPGVAMPNVTQFTGEELQSIVAYLRQLK